MEYASKRKGERLGAIRPVLLTPGTLDAAERENILAHRGRSEQYKHQYLLTDIVEQNES